MNLWEILIMKLYKWYKSHDGVSDAHHERYTDTEAVDAVEGEDGIDLSGDLTVDGNVGIGTDTPGAKLDIAGNVAISGSGTIITTTNTELVLEQTGDVYGTTRLRLRNRYGTNGAIFEVADLDLVDFIFSPSSGATQNIRYEHRNAKVYTGNTAGQWEIGPADNENLFIGAGVSGFRNGNVGIGTTAPTCKLDIAGDKMRLRTPKTPSSASGSGTTGEIAWDGAYIYVCVATDTWKRAALSTW